MPKLPPFSDTQQMLTLSLAAYQGIWSPHGDGASDPPGDGPIARSLATLTPLEGRWTLAWGPGWHRHAFGLFDDAAMFVARDEEHPSRYAVVIRGTNPVSVPDWILGDLWTSQNIPWRTGDGVADERVSLSTSLGLSILQGMRGEAAEGTRGFLSAIVKAGVNALLDPIGGVAGTALVTLRDTARELIATLAPAPLADAAARAESVLVARASQEYGALKESVGEAMRRLENGVTFDLYRFLEGGSRLRASAQSGIDLASFLRDVTDGGEATEVWVTGHSKGAALATAVARWLSDTQGRPEQWDPNRLATVHCTTFAGPTAGNGAFARGVDRALGDRLHRVANERDLVTLGWARDSLRDAPSIFAPAIAMPEVLARLVEVVAGETSALDYQQVDPQAERFRGEIRSADGGFLPEVSHQHLEAYIEHAGLSPWLKREQLFGLS